MTLDNGSKWNSHLLRRDKSALIQAKPSIDNHNENEQSGSTQAQSEQADDDDGPPPLEELPEDPPDTPDESQGQPALRHSTRDRRAPLRFTDYILTQK